MPFKDVNKKREWNRNSVHAKEHAKIPITCICGCIVTIHQIRRHERSDKHIKLMANQPVIATQQIHS